MPYQQNGQWYDDLGNPIANGSNPLAGLDNPNAQPGFADPTLASTRASISAGAVTTQHSPDYWKTHKATTPEEAQEKNAAYWAATNAGVKGQPYPDSNELKLLGGSDQTAGELATVGTGAAGGASIGGAIVPGGVGAAIGGFLGAAGGAITDAATRAAPPKAGSPQAVALAGNYSAADFGGGSSTPTMPAGSGGGYPAGGGSMPTYAPQTGSTGNPYLDALLAQTGQTTTENQAILNGTVLPAIKNQQDVTSQVGQGLGQNLQKENGLISGYQAGNTGLVQQGQSAATGANAANLGYLSSYQDTLNGMTQLNPTAYQGDWVSDPADVARQQSSYGTLSGIGGGSLDYSAAQAQLYQAQYQTAELSQMKAYEAELTLAESNGQDVSAEREALNQLKANAGGALDVTNGAASPEAYDAQKQSLAKMQSLSDPAVTAQEKFLYEQQRDKEEQDQRGSRAAVMQNLRQRGMSGSGMELTDQLGSDQITSQNRLLGDLGTQATAVARAQANLQNAGQLSTAMVGQGNQVAQGNQTVRAGSAQAQGQLASDVRGQSDLMSRFNADASNSNSQFNAGQEQDASKTNALLRESNNEFNANAYNVNQVTNAQLGESNAEFNAGAQNTASANNQSTRVQGSIAAGSQAAAMRTADDAVGMANKQQQGITNRANDTFRADQQVQATNRATDVFNAGQGTTQTNLGNTERAIGAASSLSDKSFGAGTKGTDDTADYWKTMANMGQTNTQNVLGYGTLATGVNIQGGASASDALSKAAGNFAAGQAGGSLGTNIYPTTAPTYQPFVTYAPQLPRTT